MLVINVIYALFIKSVKMLFINVLYLISIIKSVKMLFINVIYLLFIKSVESLFRKMLFRD